MEPATTAIPPRYTVPAMVLHWVVAMLVVAQFAWGWWMLGIPKQPAGLRADAFNLHKSIGLTILALMILRILWRAGHRPPALPPMPRWQARAARATHLLLYVLLVVHPLAGYLGSEFSGYPVRYFGFVLPGWAPRSVPLKDFMSAVHLATSWLIAAAVVLHLSGVAKHVIVDRDRLLARMLPFQRR